MITTQNPTAIFFDSENNSHHLISQELAEINKRGKPVISRAYGNFDDPNLKGMKEKCSRYGIERVSHQPSSKGKSVTDICLCVDAIDIMYSSPHITTFVIVSSDGDFSELTRRLRRYGKYVIAIGRKQTPVAFIRSVDEFICTDSLALEPSELTSQPEFMDIIDEAFRRGSDPSGYCLLSKMGIILKELIPEFDVSNYGKRNLTHFIRSFSPKYEVIIKLPRPTLVKRNIL